MAHLHLPARHTEDDLALAGAIAQILRSGQLWVAWSTDGGAAVPVIDATLRLPAPAAPPIAARRRGGLLGWLLRPR